MFDLIASMRMSAALVAASTGLMLAPAAVAAEPSAQIRDIQFSAGGTRLEILVLLSEQPTAAVATVTPDGVALALNGVSLAPFEVDPPESGVVSHAAGAGHDIAITSERLRSASTTLYRRSVLLVAELATPVAMAAEAPAPLAHASAAHAVAAPAPVRMMTSPRDAAGLTDATCQTAEQAFKADGWNLSALGNHLLCLISTGRTADAEPMLEQLESFAPDDWRAPFARAELMRTSDTSNAEIAYRNAIALCDTPNGRAVITHRLASLRGTEHGH